MKTIICDASWNQGWFCAVHWDSENQTYKPHIGRCIGSTQAEFIAAIRALLQVDKGETVLLISDSDAVVAAINKNLKTGKPGIGALRRELWEVCRGLKVHAFHISTRNSYPIHKHVDHIAKTVLQSFLSNYRKEAA